MTIVHIVLWIMCGVFLTLAVVFFVASRAGDNTDAQALAQIMLFPAVASFAVAVIVGLIAYFV